MTEYEKLSLEMLIHIAAGLVKLNTRPFTPTDSNAKDHGQSVQEWVQDLAKTMRKVGAAINAPPADKSN